MSEVLSRDCIVAHLSLCQALAAEDIEKYGEQSVAKFSAALAQENIEKNRYHSVLARAFTPSSISIAILLIPCFLL